VFKNKSFIVKVAKDEDLQDNGVDSPFDTHANRKDLIEDATAAAIVVVGFYMLADTARKCIIHTVATKIV
jgi:hypothetical protein